MFVHISDNRAGKIMHISLTDAERLLEFLRERRNQRSGLSQLSDDLEEASSKGKTAIVPVCERTLRRISNKTAEEIYHGQLKTPKSVLSFMNRQGRVSPENIKDALTAASDFVWTGKNKYNDLHLKRLCGRYFMYRRFWLENDPNLFMRSLVTVRFNSVLSRYQIREFQNWPKLEIRELSRGVLFPTGESIISVCNSLQKTTVKFLSISNLDLVHKTSRSPIRRFSGNGIACSDEPPHTGYGFHCERIPQASIGNPSNSISRVYTFDELKRNKFEALSGILYYENNKNVNITPTEGFL
ncbi:hypothetical protein AADZ90_021860 [Aestuariibius sp. 2305UL40-4]|uniref:hypothetical protein n=1 Tax=Aestuariibius violaceus TaxID=3234132 RepID=UPI00345F039C